MFTNIFRKFKTGGSVDTSARNKASEIVSKASKNSNVPVEKLIDKLKGFSSDTEKQEFANLLVAASSDEESTEKNNAIKKLQKECNSVFEDGGKFQSFICKHGHGGVNCGCGGGKVVRGAEGMEAPGNPYEGWKVLPRQWRNNPDGSTQAIQVVVSPDGNTGYQRIITDRSQMGDRNGMAVRDTVYSGGAYGNGKVWVDASQNLTQQEKDALDEYLNRKVSGNQSGGILKGENGLSKAAGYYQRHANEGIIRKLQMFLAGRGYYDGDFTGKFDNAFYDAVKNYQKDNGLVDDGMWGEDTNEVHRVLGAGDTTFNGSRSGAHPGKHTYGSDFVNREYMTRGSVKMSDINAVIEKAIINPEWFWGDSDDAKAWRLLLEKGSPNGRGGTNYGAILEDIWRETPDEIKSRIPYSKLPNSIKSAVYNQGISNAINDSTPYVVGALSLPALANPLATLGAVTGAELLGTAGRNVGSDMQRLAIDPQTGQILGYVNQNDSPSPELVGFSTPTIIPDRSNNGEGLGKAIGTVLGAGIGNAANEAVIDLNYNPTGIEMKLGEPKLKLQEKRVIKPKGGGWRRPGTGDPSRFSGKEAYWVRRMTGEPIKDSEISGYILERDGGRIEKHQQENNLGRGILGRSNNQINTMEYRPGRDYGGFRTLEYVPGRDDKIDLGIYRPGQDDGNKYLPNVINPSNNEGSVWNDIKNKYLPNGTNPTANNASSIWDEIRNRFNRPKLAPAESNSNPKLPNLKDWKNQTVPNKLGDIMKKEPTLGSRLLPPLKGISGGIEEKYLPSKSDFPPFRRGTYKLGDNAVKIYPNWRGKEDNSETFYPIWRGNEDNLPIYF